MIIMNLGIFSENFMNFGEGEIFLKIHETIQIERNSLIGWKVLMGATWSQESDWVQVGDAKQGRSYLGAGKVFEKKRSVCELGACILSLIKPDVWGRITRTKSIRSAPLPSFTSSAAEGSHRNMGSSPSSFANSSLPIWVFNRSKSKKMEESSIGDEKL
jgi:hypothetical protein